MLRRPLCQRIEIATLEDLSIPGPLTFNFLDQSGVRVAQQSLSQDIHTVHGMVVSCFAHCELWLLEQCHGVLAQNTETV